MLLLLLLLSRFSRVRLCATPETAAHQAPPSLGFSRQEHWSGLPFPSPMHESGKWKVKVKSCSRVRLLETPWTAAYQAPPSMGFSRQEYWSGLPLPSQCLLKAPTVSSCDSQWADVAPGEKTPASSGALLKSFTVSPLPPAVPRALGSKNISINIRCSQLLDPTAPLQPQLESNVLILLIYFFIYKMKIIITTLRIILKKSARII